MLVCINCARPIVFGPHGWAHRDPDSECNRLVVAWPPPGAENHEEGEGEDAA